MKRLNEINRSQLIKKIYIVQSCQANQVQYWRNNLPLNSTTVACFILNTTDQLDHFHVFVKYICVDKVLGFFHHIRLSCSRGRNGWRTITNFTYLSAPVCFLTPRSLKQTNDRSRPNCLETFLRSVRCSLQGGAL